MPDAYDDIAAILSPPVGEDEGDESVQAARDQAEAERRQISADLRLADEEDHQDPLLSSLTRARRVRDQADQQLRHLIAYGREFVRPRPYTLDQLASAAGFRTTSAIGKAYGRAEVEAVEAATGVKPRGRRAVDPVEQPTVNDLLIDLQRRSPAPARVPELAHLLQQVDWTVSVPAARTPGARTTRRYLVWRRTWPNGTAVTLYQEPARLGTGNNIDDSDRRRLFLGYTDGEFSDIARRLDRYHREIDDLDAATGRR